MNKTDTTWSLVPTGEIKSAVGGRLARGEGNHASCEFNSASRVLILLLVSSRLVPHLAVTHAVLYRWHAAASEKDTQWLEGLMSEFNGGKPFSEASPLSPALRTSS